MRILLYGSVIALAYLLWYGLRHRKVNVGILIAVVVPAIILLILIWLTSFSSTVINSTF
jgi:hypothetical protein